VISFPLGSRTNLTEREIDMPKTLFPIPTDCLYHGSKAEYHGDAKVYGPLADGCYRVIISEKIELITRDRRSFTVND
jgi:hypothetical protein